MSVTSPLRVVRLGLTVLLVGGAVAVAALGAGARLGPVVGVEPFAIRSGSMEPALGIGSLAIVTRSDHTPEAGEVIAFRLPNGAVVTHRVVDVVNSEAGTYLATKGDANESPDASLVPLESVIGPVAVAVPLLGFLLVLLGTPIGVVTILSIAGTLLTAIWLLEELEDAERSEPRSPTTGVTQTEGVR
jgi:signal peptidase